MNESVDINDNYAMMGAVEKVFMEKYTDFYHKHVLVFSLGIDRYCPFIGIFMEYPEHQMKYSLDAFSDCITMVAYRRCKTQEEATEFIRCGFVEYVVDFIYENLKANSMV